MPGSGSGRPESCGLCRTPELTLRHRDIVVADGAATPTLRSLWNCGRCHAYWSLLPPSIDSPAYYEQKPEADHLLLEDASERFRRVRRAVEDALGRSRYRLLDVGSATGVHFDFYPDTVEKFAVEPAASAVDALGRRGATWLGPTLESAAPATFDVVTALDVLEHIARPATFLDSLAQRLAPGGILALVTGDIDSFSARWSGRRWLYYALPEHCSFFSARALTRYLSREHGLERVRKTWIANRDVDLAYVRGFARGLAVETVMKLLPARRARALERAGRGRFPFFCDNMLLTFRRPSPA